jgi:hypothetical protein
MTRTDLDLAAEFCRLVGKRDLIDYLGLAADARASDAVDALRARRKYLQGMQSNPKYKAEALFLIKNVGTFEALLKDLDGYLREARPEVASEALPGRLYALELAVRGALLGGAPKPEHRELLRQVADGLGATTEELDGVITRVKAEISREDAPAADLYRVLGVTPDAPNEVLLAAWEARRAEIDRAAGPEAAANRRRVDRAGEVLTHTEARRSYDLGRITTGPPARDRADTRVSSSAPTAPPVRERMAAPHMAAPPPVPSGPLTGRTLGLDRPVEGYQLIGPPVRRIPLSRTAVIETLRLRAPAANVAVGRVTSQVPWITVTPTDLDPADKEPTVAVRVDMDHVPPDAHDALVVVSGGRGEPVRVRFEIDRGARAGFPRGAILAIAALTLLAVLVAIALAARASGPAPAVEVSGE